MKKAKDSKYIPMTSVSSGKGREVRKDVFYYTDQIVNVIFLGDPQEDRPWIMIDAGMPGSGKELLAVAKERFGRPPAAILLTHGHADHVGSLVDLLEVWDVPVYAHRLEFPYLTGLRPYPKPDASVEGGFLAKISFILPIEPVDVHEHLRALPDNQQVPNCCGWEWIHTPGHTPGHVSFFREADGTLISGDAFVTVKQDELYKVLVQKEEIHGPPVYLTTDWEEAKNSVIRLAALEPDLVISGHGTAMEGEELAKGLKELAAHFDELAVPSYGRYVG